MQLKSKQPGLSLALASATSSLLTAAGTAVADEDIGWEINSSVLYYGEMDSRVQDASFAVSATRRFEDGRVLALGVTTDSLTGATPNGAVRYNRPQTFTRPSARGQYVTPAGKTPTDDTFKDARGALFSSWTQPLGDLWSVTAGITFSQEYDYSHIGLNGSVSRELARGNRTLSAGFAYAQDDQDPAGGIPIPLSEMRGVNDLSNRDGKSRDKEVTDLLFGVSQIINEKMIGQVNYSFSHSTGYLNDPFKVLAVLDSNGELIPGPDGLYSYRFESRPSDRTKQSIFLKLKTWLRGGPLDTSYRYMTDDWGIRSHTFDTRYRINLDESTYFEPHFRYYSQSEADFYRPNLQAAEPLPLTASADSRLGKFTGTTLGLKYGHRLNSGSEVAARIEWYSQSGQSKLQGVNNAIDVFPGLDSVILQVSYRFHL